MDLRALAGSPIKLPLPARARGRLAQLRTLVRRSEVLQAFVAAFVGAGAGCLVTALSRVTQTAHELFFGLALDQRLSASDRISLTSALLVPPLGGLLLGATEYARRRARRSAAVDPVEANALRGGRMSMRDSLLVSLQTAISNGCGASVGLEAGYTQLGAGLGSRIGSLLRLRRGDLRVMLGAGAAAAISAAFGAPLTGAFYAFEVVIGIYSISNLAPVMAASLTGALVARELGGAPYIIESTAGGRPGLTLPLLLLILSLAASLLGVSVMKAVAYTERFFEWTRLPVWCRPVVGGLLVGGLALVTPQVLSAGHGAMHEDLFAPLTIGAIVTLIGLKLLAALLSLGSGFRGGLFFASLFLGSLLGKLVCAVTLQIWPDSGVETTTVILAGMAVQGVAIVGGPLTMSFLVLETSHDLGLTGAVLATCVATSTLVRETFGYSFSTWRLHLRGETIRSAHDVGWIRNLTVGSLMRRDIATVPGTMTVEEFRREHPLGSGENVVALDAGGGYLGQLHTSELFAPSLDARPNTPVGMLVDLRETALVPSMNLKTAMSLFDRAETDGLAVLDSAEARQVVGWLNQAHATRRYAQELNRVNSELTGDDA